MFELGNLLDPKSEFRKILDSITVPVYVTELRSGKFRFVNPALANLLLHDVEFFYNSNFTAKALYANEAERSEWEHRIRQEGRKKTVATIVELVQNQDKNHDHRRLFVVDLSMLIKTDGQEMALGMLGDISQEKIKSERTMNRLIAFQQLLNLSWVNVGIHEIDDQGNVVWMNKKEKELFGVSWDSGHHVTELSKASNDLGKRQRVFRKILGTHPLTEGEHRMFFNEKENRYLPVNIHDFPIWEPDPIHEHHFNCGLVTAVGDERTQYGLTLEQFLPQNPLLEEIGLCAFVKVLRSWIHDYDPELGEFPGSNEDFVFVYGNGPFKEEIRQLHPDKTIDIRGMTDDELFSDFAGSYRKADDELIKLARDEEKAKHSHPAQIQVERIEKHPSRKGVQPIDVQVVKIPLYWFNEKGQREVIGVQGFYWDVRKTDIHHELAELHEPWNFLNRLSIPIYRKDKNLQFTYANTKYLEYAKQFSKCNAEGMKVVRSLSHIIGKRESDIFDETIASSHSEEDQQLINSAIDKIRKINENDEIKENDKISEISKISESDKIDKVEVHKGIPVRIVKEVFVKTILDDLKKTADDDPNKVTLNGFHSQVLGVQGVCWPLSQEELQSMVQFNCLTGELRLSGISEPRKFEYDNGHIPRYVQVLQLLIDNFGRPVKTEDIGRRIWGNVGKDKNEKDKDNVQVQINTLKEKLKALKLDKFLSIRAKKGEYTLDFIWKDPIYSGEQNTSEP